MPSHEELGSDFVSIVVADGTRIHTQLLADALRNDRGLQVAAAASNSEELLAAITRVPIDLLATSNRVPLRRPQLLNPARDPRDDGRYQAIVKRHLAHRFQNAWKQHSFYDADRPFLGLRNVDHHQLAAVGLMDQRWQFRWRGPGSGRT